MRPCGFASTTLFLLLVASACHEPLFPEHGEEVQPRSAPWLMAPRYVGVLDPSFTTCVDDSFWVARPLFDPDTLAMMPMLGRYCVYTWTGGAAGPVPFTQPFVDTHVRLDPDPDILVPQTQLNPTPLSHVRAERAWQALGASLAVNSPPTGWSDSGVDVAIVDTADSTYTGNTAPDPFSVPLPQLHGVRMREVIDALRCPFGSSECLESQFFAQAFPYDSSSAEPLGSGGELGSVGSLAAAIGEAVARWKLTEGSHLVISMSVGWDPGFRWSPEFGEVPGEMGVEVDDMGVEVDETGSESGETGSESGEMPTSSGPYDLPESFDPYEMLLGSDVSTPAPVQAAYAALAWAACEGALSIAAAGNNRGPRCEQQGPMAPASWEVHASSVEMCEALQLFPAFETGGSLVYAAGGLDPADEPIANARLGSMPPRALHAHQVTVAGGHPDPLTGTSLAAAALSAIAAQLWGQRPGDSATDIMAQLDASGVPLASAVEWGNSLGSSVVRIDAYAALDAAGVPNPYLPSSSATTLGPSGSLGAAIDLMTASKTYAPLTAPVLGANPPAQNTRCSPAPVTIHGNVALPIAPDPRADETRPQPTVPICPNCALRTSISSVTGSNINSGSHRLYLEIDPVFTTSSPPIPTIHPTLTFRHPNGYLEYELGPITSYQAEIDLDPTILATFLNTNPSVATALLSLKIDDGPIPSWHVAVVDVVP